MGLFGILFDMYKKNKKMEEKTLKKETEFKVEKLSYENFDTKLLLTI